MSFQIYLDAVESSDSASSTLKREKRQSGDASSSATFHFGSAANKLVSLRDRAKIAFGGSLDSILKVNFDFVRELRRRKSD